MELLSHCSVRIPLSIINSTIPLSTLTFYFFIYICNKIMTSIGLINSNFYKDTCMNYNIKWLSPILFWLFWLRTNIFIDFMFKVHNSGYNIRYNMIRRSKCMLNPAGLLYLWSRSPISVCSNNVPWQYRVSSCRTWVKVFISVSSVHTLGVLAKLIYYMCVLWDIAVDIEQCL